MEREGGVERARERNMQVGEEKMGGDHKLQQKQEEAGERMGGGYRGDGWVCWVQGPH